MVRCSNDIDTHNLLFSLDFIVIVNVPFEAAYEMEYNEKKMP